MFTGIIQDIGTVRALEGGNRVVRIGTRLPLGDVVLGASIACSGVCLTVVRKTESDFTAELSPETLAKTTAATWTVGGQLNLERPLRLGDELGGHLVLGHVDGCCEMHARHEDGPNAVCVFQTPPDLARFLAPKGSVVLDGISLTLVEADRDHFSVALIPHTLSVTTASTWAPGRRVNLEVDVLARYVDRLLTKAL